MHLSTTTAFLLLALLVLLIIVAFSSGTEVAMLSVNRYRIRHRAQGGDAPGAGARSGCCRSPMTGWARIS